MKLWLISLTISTLSHPTVLWSCYPHPTVLSVWWPNEIVTHFTHHIYTLVSNSFIRLGPKWDCDSFHSSYLHFSVKQFYQCCVQMRLWLISLTISTRSHPTVSWSWCPHPTVLSVWWPNEIVTYFTHFLYTLESNSFISCVSKWDCDSFHSPYLHFHIQLCYEVGVHILLFYQFWWPNEIVTYFTHFLYTLVSNCFIRSQIVWCSNGTTTHTTLNVNVTKFIWTGVIVKFQKGNMCVKLAWLNT